MSSAPRLHVECSGTRGADPYGIAVLCHGFGGSARNFRPQARALGALAEVRLYDARGHARSEAPSAPSDYQLSSLVSDLARVVDEAGSGPCVVGGLSMGALTALSYTLANPERVSGLVLAAFPADAPEARSWALRFADAIEQEGTSAALERFILGPEGRFDPGAASFIRQGFLEHSPYALVSLLRETLAVTPTFDDLADSLTRVHCPTLLVVGDRDEPSVVASSRLAKLLPSARLAIIKNAGHVVNLAATRPFNEVLLEWYGAITQPSLSYPQVVTRS